MTNGHGRVLAAFNHFQEVLLALYATPHHFYNTSLQAIHEPTRFHTLMALLRSAHERGHVGLQLASLSFINALVYGVKDLNFQVVLQHEFYVLGMNMTMSLLGSNDAPPEVVDRLTALAENYLDVTALVRRFDSSFFIHIQPYYL